MKYARLFIVLLVLPMLTIAQQSTGGDGSFGSMFPDKAISPCSIGIFAGSNSNTHVVGTAYASDMKYTPASGLTAGINAAYHITGWFSLSADFALVQKNYRLDRDNPSLSFVYTDATNNYLSLPVMAVISVGRTFRVVAFAGGYVGYWLSGHRSGQSLSVSYFITRNQDDTFFDEDYEFNEQRDNRFDSGIVYGAGMRCAIARKIDLSADVRWYYGLTDIQKSYMTNMNPRYNTTRTIQFGVAYWL